MWKQSFLLIAFISTSFCVSRVVSTAHKAYMRGSSDDNSNPFVAARQRLKQQQQKQFQQPQYIQLKNNYFDDDDNNKNNNMEYNSYIQQRLQNGLVSFGGPNNRENTSGKRSGAQENESEQPTRTQKSDFNEIFSEYQNGAQAQKSKGIKSDLHVDYEVSPGESQHSSKQMQNEISKIFQQSGILRRSSALPTDQSTPESADEEELDLDLPYGIQNVRKRIARHKPDHSKAITYQSLCPTKRIAIPLETTGYEYRPSHYIEVTCAHYTPAHNFEFRKNRICSEAGFSCIQLNRTIHLIRRNKASTDECWESEIRIVPSGCECMWPKHDNGDIAAYHEAQKRFGAYANVHANADYEQGEGYRQIQPQQSELFGINGLRRNENEDGVGFEAFEYN
ncbi:uncharacterized protein LOC101448602 [Ceratitis capitata]|uniref:uncharacterized protein LOC101448602 n=1 Tax=Ceratitis capitata TaxID=7213 RepID=UPI000A109A90|nr:uncharacterized protein LOC101448602 [Ceratitis capitata]